jgi:PleD family two-component response regulator
VEDVLREVDLALYAAKAEGRNRCKLAMPPALV